MAPSLPPPPPPLPQMCDFRAAARANEPHQLHTHTHTHSAGPVSAPEGELIIAPLHCRKEEIKREGEKGVNVQNAEDLIHRVK